VRPHPRDAQALRGGRRRDYGWCASHSRYLWGFRPHAIFAPDGTPRLGSPNADEREIGLTLPDRCQRHGGEVLLGDGGHASHGFAAQVAERDATFMRPCPKQEPGTRPHLAPIRQPIESILWTGKNLPTVERFCLLAAAITPNHLPENGGQHDV
jgi:hypothetical protein